MPPRPASRIPTVSPVNPKKSSSRPDAEVVLTRATEADWPGIWPIWHEIVTAGETIAYDPAADSETSKRSWFSGSDEVWVARAGGATDVLGTYKLGPNRPGAGSHVATATYLVSSGARGRGVGRAMVRHCLDRAAGAGYRGIQFNAVVATNVYAVALYEDLGFSVTGRIPGGFRHPEHGFVDLLIMYCDLIGYRDL
jgi:ribosomal protein S18 acetylase RimI-like enzyme